MAQAIASSSSNAALWAVVAMVVLILVSDQLVNHRAVGRAWDYPLISRLDSPSPEIHRCALCPRHLVGGNGRRER